MNDLGTLRVRLKYWRTRRALSVTDLAQLAKVSNVTIIKIEKEGRLPRPKVVHKLLVALDITLEELMVDDSEHPKAGDHQPAA